MSVSVPFRSILALLIDAAPLPGDYNDDGTVDLADYVVWRDTDGNQPGYDAWRENFGNSLGSATGFGSRAAVPEPMSAVLAVLATMALAVLVRLPRVH